MKPPYQLSHSILLMTASISEKIGAIKSYFLERPSPLLRKQNKIRTIHSSLKIEGNTLTQEQITAIIENKRVIGPQKDIKEVLNAVKVYDQLALFDPFSSKSFLSAHKLLLDGLIENPGKFRNQNVNVFQGSRVAHLAPPPGNVPLLMKDLFSYLKSKDEMTLIKSCVFHYEIEFIHPFLVGNGRMGRLWQTVVLMKEYPVFEYLPFETLISHTQKEYYKVLAKCDKKGDSTEFIEYMLNIIDSSLRELLSLNNRLVTDIERIDYFISLGKSKFSRKDYMNVFRNLSSATASRDLKKGVELNLFTRIGDKNKTRYKITSGHNMPLNRNKTGI
ncbi:MAG: Fic family protein [Bacteroidetes bacterium]|nr:Fic family protein [Bacteroidota bacterium]